MKKYFLNLFKNHQNINKYKLPTYNLDISCLPLDKVKSSKRFILENPIENEAFQKKSYLLFSKIKKRLSREIYIKLNLLHKTKFSHDYWDSILGFYIEVIIGIVFQRFILLKKIKNKRNFSYTTKLLKINPEDIAPNSCDHFINYFLLHNKTIIHYIDSSIITKLRICHYTKSSIYLKEKFKIKNNYINKKIKLLYLLSELYLKFFPSPNNIFLTTINPRFMISSFLKKFKLPIFLREPNLNYIYNNKYRKWSINMKTKNQLEKILIEIFPKILPKSILEGYKINKSYIDRYYKSIPKNIFFSDGVSDLFKILIAEKKLNGSKIINIQHGGNYGKMRRYLNEEYEYKYSDYFLSYGFSKNLLSYKLRTKIIRIGPIDLEKKKSNILQEDKYLFILPHFIFNYLQMNSYPWTMQKFKHLNQIINMLNNLDDRKKKISEIRLHQFDQKEILNYMKKKIINFHLFKICKNEKINFERYSLVISLYPGTTMIQSLYKNIPTIFCFPLNFFKLNHKAKDYFNKLQKNNIFINELNKLSAIINNVNFEPNYWWSKKKC